MTTSLHFLDRGEGKPILWIHGFPLSSSIYESQLDIPGYRHIAPDLPGFGETPPPEEPVSMEAYADELFRLLDHLEIRRAAFAGLSMGGYVALAAARKDPSRIAALLLVDTREIADTPEGRQKRFDTIAAVEREGVTFVRDDMLPKLLSPDADDALKARLVGIIQGCSRRGVTAALEAMANRADSTDLLPRLRVPTLVVVGSRDVITPPADAERMVGAIPGARLAVIEGAGHLSNFERPGEFNRIATDFLREHY